MTENTPDQTAVTGQHTTNGTPRGYSSITPFLAVTDTAGALAFYQEVFGASVVSSMEAGGVIVHAELQLDQGRLQVGSPMPDHHLLPQPDGDDVSCSFVFYCPDVDAVVERAAAAGATVREPLMTFASGDRFASIRDPFGVRWSVMTRVEDLSDEESSARVQEWLAAQG